MAVTGETRELAGLDGALGAIASRTAEVTGANVVVVRLVDESGAARARGGSAEAGGRAGPPRRGGVPRGGGGAGGRAGGTAPPGALGPGGAARGGRRASSAA